MKIFEIDGKVYNPLGGGSYVYKDCFMDYIVKQLKKDKVKISIGAQPNSSPHFGTITVFSLAFGIAKILKEEYKKEVTVFFEMIDTAPSYTEEINGIKYQKSLRNTNKLLEYLPQYYEMLELLSKYTNVDYEVRRQEEFNKHDGIPEIVSKIIEKRDILGPILEPNKEKIRIRSSCPKCGLADKNGINNIYSGGKLICICPIHGEYTVDIKEESFKLEYNTPMRNLIRAMIYSKDNLNENLNFEWLRITGADYAGFYQEQILYKPADILGVRANELPIIIYSPLILDWSGAKLSKSLYVKKGAYRDLPEYIQNYEKLINCKGVEGLYLVYNEVYSWIKEPYKLFRNYSIYYFINIFEK